MFVLIENGEWVGVTLCQKTDSWRAVAYRVGNSPRWKRTRPEPDSQGDITGEGTLEYLESALSGRNIRRKFLNLDQREYELISNEEGAMILFSAEK